MKKVKIDALERLLTNHGAILSPSGGTACANCNMGEAFPCRFFWQVKLYQHKHAQMKTNTSRLANYTHVGHTVHRFWPDFWMTRLYLQSAPGAKGFDSINTAPFFKLIIPRVKLQMAPATPGWYLSGHVARYPRQILRR